jgi:hypothetical protein
MADRVREWLGFTVDATPDGKPDIKNFDPFFLAQSSGPLKRWTSSDIARFRKEDPVNGENLAKMNLAAKIHLTGAAVGAIGSGLYLFRHSRSFIGLALGGAAGALAGALAAEGLSTPALGLQNVDAVATNHAFLKWWAARQ